MLLFLTTNVNNGCFFKLLNNGRSRFDRNSVNIFKCSGPFCSIYDPKLANSLRPDW